MQTCTASEEANLSDQLKTILTDLGLEPEWRISIAGLIFQAATFAMTTESMPLGTEYDKSYKDIQLSLNDPFYINHSDSIGSEKSSELFRALDAILHCMDFTEFNEARPAPQNTKTSEKPAIISIHGYVPQLDVNETPHLPNIKRVHNESSAVLAVSPSKGTIVAIVPCFQGWLVLPKARWNERLVFIQISHVDVDAVACAACDERVNGSPTKSSSSSSDDSSSNHTGATASPDTNKQPIPDELRQLYCVLHAACTRGIRTNHNGQLVNQVPEDLPLIKCKQDSGCEPQPASKLVDLAAKIKAEEVKILDCTSAGFLGFEHCTVEDQIETLVAWESELQTCFLEHDLKNIRATHMDFLKRYNIAHPGRDSFKHVNEAADVDKNCAALRQSACWQRGKNACYPGFTFVLVDVPTKQEDLESNRRVKKGSSAPPWNKVIYNMTVPSESMVTNNRGNKSCLQSECPLFKVPINNGIEEHVRALRAKTRVRTKKQKIQ